jgi:hypothetical protein
MLTDCCLVLYIATEEVLTETFGILIFLSLIGVKAICGIVYEGIFIVNMN